MLMYYHKYDITCYVRRRVFSVRVTLQWWDDIDVSCFISSVIGCYHTS